MSRQSIVLPTSALRMRVHRYFETRSYLREAWLCLLNDTNIKIRKKYFEEKSLYSLFRNVIPEVVFDFLREIGVFYKNMRCVKVMFV